MGAGPHQHRGTEHDLDHPTGGEQPESFGRGESAEHEPGHHHRDRRALPGERGALVLEPGIEDRGRTLAGHARSTTRITAATTATIAVPIAIIIGSRDVGSGSFSRIDRSLSAQRR